MWVYNLNLSQFVCHRSTGVSVESVSQILFSDLELALILFHAFKSNPMMCKGLEYPPLNVIWRVQSGQTNHYSLGLAFKLLDIVGMSDQQLWPLPSIQKTNGIIIY